MKKKLIETYKKLNTSKPILFEAFCEDCSYNGVSKEEIIEWLSEHETLWKDAKEYAREYGAQDPSWCSADELEEFISDHDAAWEDYCNYFNLSLENEDEELHESVDYLKNYNYADSLYEIFEEMLNQGYSLDDIRDTVIGEVEGFIESYSHLDSDEDELEESLIKEGKEFDFDKINRKLHGNIDL